MAWSFGRLGRLLRPNHVAERRHAHSNAIDVERLAAVDQSVVVLQPGGREGEIEIPATRRQVQHRHRLEQRGVGIERDAVGRLLDAQAGVERAQRFGEPLEVGLDRVPGRCPRRWSSTASREAPRRAHRSTRSRQRDRGAPGKGTPDREVQTSGDLASGSEHAAHVGDRRETLRRGHRELLADLRPVDIVGHGREHESPPTRAQNASQGREPGLVAAALPPRDDRLRRAETLGQSGLREARLACERPE